MPSSRNHLRRRNGRAAKAARSATAGATRLTMAELAHELNSLLDGSLRNLGQARHCLEVIEAESHGVDEDILPRLDDAENSLRRMADLLARAMAGRNANGTKFDPAASATLGQVVQDTVHSFAARTADLGIQVVVQVSPAAAALPGITLGPVISNALANAINACEAAPHPSGSRVELSLALTRKGQVELTVTDTGCGLRHARGPATTGGPNGESTPKVTGHGIGLGICRRIIDRLGGHMALTNVPFGRGAVFQACVPARSLSSRE